MLNRAMGDAILGHDDPPPPSADTKSQVASRLTRWLTAVLIGLVLAPGSALFGTILLLLIAPIVRPGSLPQQWSLILLLGVAGGSLYAAPTTLIGLPLVCAAANPRKTLRRRRLIAWGFALGALSMAAIVAATREVSEAMGAPAIMIILIGGTSGAFAGFALGSFLKDRIHLP